MGNGTKVEGSELNKDK